jgi:cysteine desulfuration protein SufE
VNFAGKTPLERATELASELGRWSDPQARFAWLVEEARRRPFLPAEYRRDEFRVTGCQVRTWFVPEFRDKCCWYRLDSDAASLKALGGVLCDFYSGWSPGDVEATSPSFLEALNLGGLLAENRRRTVWRIRELIREFAVHQSGGPTASIP